MPLEWIEEGQRQRREERARAEAQRHHAVKEFYKVMGKKMTPVSYSGSPSEVELFHWQSSVEEYFSTFGIEKGEAQVVIGGALLEGDAAKWWTGIKFSNRKESIGNWQDLLDKIRERFIPPDGDMKMIGAWRRMMQTGTVAAYADHFYKVQAVCSMARDAEFKLAYYGLRAELQAEVRKYMRLNKREALTPTEMFRVAGDAEVGMVKRPVDLEPSGKTV